MRLKLSLLSLSVYLAMTLAAHAVMPQPAIDLQADILAKGDVLQWANGNSCGYGLAGKKFVACGQPPTCDVFQGVQGIYFNGANGFVSQYGADGVPWSLPGDLFGGSSPYTVVYTALNPNYNNSYENVFAWTNRVGADYQKACFFMGTHDSYGAINHYGTENDMAYDRGVPQAGVWHNVTVTYSGITGWEKIYVDGVISAIEKKPTDQLNNIEVGDPIYIGLTDDTNITSNYSGWIHSIQAYPQEATNDEVLAINGMPSITQMPTVPTLVNPSFELVQGDVWVVPVGSTSVNRCDSRTIPGWAYVPANDYVDGSARRGGIGVNVPNRGMVPGGGWWDNGLNFDGNRCLVLVGQSTTGRAVSQYCYLKSGKTYHMRVYYNAAATGSAIMNIGIYNMLHQNVDTLDNMPITVNPVEQQWSWTVPFYEYEGNFTVPSNGQYSIQISNDQPGSGNVLLVDKVELYENNPPKPMGGWPYPATIDFGNVQKGGNKTLAFTVQNMGSNTLNLTLYSRTGANANSVDFTDSVKPGTSGSTPNIQILGYQNTDLHVKFTAGSTTGTYSGNLMVRYTNGPFAADQYMPWTAFVPGNPTLTNPSFEYPYNANEQYADTAWYANYGQSYKIPGWLDTATSHGIGVGDRNNGQMVNNGYVPDGHQALWIQGFRPDDSGSGYWYAGKSRSVSQVVPGFRANHVYKIVMYVNTRSQGNNRSYFQFKLNGTPLKPVTTPGTTTWNNTWNGIPNVLGVGRLTGNWARCEYDFTQGASDGANTFELVNVYDTTTGNNGESCLLVDAIKVYDLADGPVVRPAHTTGLGYWTTQYMGDGYPINFGTGTSGSPNYNTKYLRIYNEGGKDLKITGLQITGANARDFTIYSGTTSALPITIKGYGNSTVSGTTPPADLALLFTPKAGDVGGIGDANLVISTEGTTQTTKVPLYGVANNFPVLLNQDFQSPPVYWDNTGTIWRTYAQNLNPTGWSMSSGLTGNPPVDNYGANNTGVTDRIFVSAPINDQYQTSFYVNNGQMVNPQVGVIQGGTSGQGGSMAAPKGVYQNVDGFQAGNTYHVKALVNARYTGAAPNDNTVRGVLLHYKGPGIPWTNLADPADISNVDPQFTYATPFTTIEGDIVCPVGASYTGRYTIELWVPQQSFDESLLVQSITISGPPMKAVKSWTAFE